MNYKSFFRAVVLFSLIASVVGGVFMALSLIQSSDSRGVNMFSSANVRFFDLVFWIFLCCSAASLLASVAVKGKMSKKLSSSSATDRVVYAVMGVGLTLAAVFSLFRELTAEANGYEHGNMYVVFERTIDGKSTFSILYFCFILFLFASAFFCFFAASSKSKQGSVAFSVLSLFPALAIIFKLIYDFLLQSGNSYGSLYNYHLIGLSFALLFCINETRFYMKRGVPYVYALFGLISASATVIFSLSALLLFFAGKAGANWHPVFCAIDIFIVAYIYYRLFNIDIVSYVEKSPVIEGGVSLCEDASSEA